MPVLQQFKAKHVRDCKADNQMIEDNAQLEAGAYFSFQTCK